MRDEWKPEPEMIRAWCVLSEFFLDTDIDHEAPWLARKLAATPYSESQLWALLAEDVAPVVGPNLLTVAGVWTGFDDAWLEGQIRKRRRSRILRSAPFRWLWRAFATVTVGFAWSRVLRRVAEVRAGRDPDFTSPG